MKLTTILFPLTGIALTLAGCSGSDPILPNQNGALQATISMLPEGYGSFAESRAVEWLHEDAVGNEGFIHDALVFIYTLPLASAQISPSGTDEYASTTVSAVKQVNASAGATGVYTTERFSLTLDPGTYYAFAVANPNGVTASTFEGMTLRQVLDYVYNGAVCTAGATIKQNDRFVMCSTSELSFVVPNDPTDEALYINGAAGPLVMRRLAARVDLSFGETSTTTFLTDATHNVTFDGSGNPSATVNMVQLPVYDYDDYIYDGSLNLTGDTYTITDVNMLAAVLSGEYMIQRINSSNLGYFQDEGCKTVTGTYAGTYANKTLEMPTVSKQTVDLNLASVVTAGRNLYTSGSARYYTLGYFCENTKPTNNKDTDKKTTVQIKGTYHRLGDLDKTAGDFTADIEVVLRHCYPESGAAVQLDRAMSYAVGRNSIYRLRLDRIFADADKVYVRWYYDSDNNGTYDAYTAVDAITINRVIGEGDGTSPND